MKPIVFLHPHLLKAGGASRVVLEFANRLATMGMPTVIIVTQKNDLITKDYKNVKIISLEWLTTGNPLFWLLFPLFISRLAKVLKKYPGSPLFCHSLAIYWGAKYKETHPKIKTVYYFHDLGMPYTDSQYEIDGLPFFIRPIAKIFLPYFRRLNKKVIANADFLIANSQTSGKAVRNIYDREVDTIITPGIDIDLFHPTEIKDDYIYSLGRLENIKNMDFVIRSFYEYTKIAKNKFLQLKIVGDGIERKNLEKLATDLDLNDRVNFLGYQSKESIAVIAQKAKIGLFLSTNESFGLAPLESLASGTPVIGINTNGTAEIVTDGKTGYLTSLNKTRIAVKIQDLLSQPELLRLLSKNSVLASKNYDWKFKVKQLAKYFERI